MENYFMTRVTKKETSLNIPDTKHRWQYEDEVENDNEVVDEDED